MPRPPRPGEPSYPHMLERKTTYQEATLELHRLENMLHEIHAIVPGRLDVRAIVATCRVKARKVRKYLEGER